MDKQDIYFDLFAHSGWIEFIKEQERVLEDLKMQCHLAKTMEEFHFQRGMIQQLTNLVNFAELFRQQVDALKEVEEWSLDT